MRAAALTIYNILASGPRSVAQLIDATKKTDKYIRVCLDELSDAGKVRRAEAIRAKRMGPPTYLWERVA